MLKQLEEMTRLVRILTEEENANLPQSHVPALLVSIGYAKRTEDGIVVLRKKLIDAFISREIYFKVGVGRGTRISIIKWLLDNPS